MTKSEQVYMFLQEMGCTEDDLEFVKECLNSAKAAYPELSKDDKRLYVVALFLSARVGREMEALHAKTVKLTPRSDGSLN